MKVTQEIEQLILWVYFILNDFHIHKDMSIRGINGTLGVDFNLLHSSSDNFNLYEKISFYHNECIPTVRSKI